MDPTFSGKGSLSLALLKTTTATCPHFSRKAADPSGGVCEECGTATSLRVCLDCGHVGCCESHHGHNTAHYRDSGHAVIRSMPVGKDSFTWCYECNTYL